MDVLAPERSLAHTPIYQVMLAWENNQAPALELPGLTATALPASTGTARTDLTLNLSESADSDGDTGLAVWVEYRTDLFDQDTIAGWMGMWRRILDQLVADPDLPVGLINPIGAVERMNAVRVQRDRCRCHSGVDSGSVHPPGTQNP